MVSPKAQFLVWLVWVIRIMPFFYLFIIYCLYTNVINIALGYMTNHYMNQLWVTNSTYFPTWRTCIVPSMAMAPASVSARSQNMMLPDFVQVKDKESPTSTKCSDISPEMRSRPSRTNPKRTGIVRGRLELSNSFNGNMIGMIRQISNTSPIK